MERSANPAFDFLLNYQCPDPSSVPDDIYDIITANINLIFELWARIYPIAYLPSYGVKYDRDNNRVSILEPPPFWKTEQPMVILPIRIVLENGRGHANILIIDEITRTLELFEPHGTCGRYYLAVSTFIREYFEPLGYRLVEPEFCVLGPQALYREPICGTLSLIYAWSRITQPNAPYLMSEFSNLLEDEIRTLVENFHCFIYFYLIQSGYLDLFFVGTAIWKIYHAGREAFIKSEDLILSNRGTLGRSDIIDPILSDAKNLQQLYQLLNPLSIDTPISTYWSLLNDIERIAVRLVNRLNEVERLLSHQHRI